MIRAIIWMALVAGLMGLANAASTVYEQFQLGTSGWLDTAAPITLVLGGIVDTLDNCRTICNNVANCPGAVYCVYCPIRYLSFSSNQILSH